MKKLLSTLIAMIIIAASLSVPVFAVDNTAKDSTTSSINFFTGDVTSAKWINMASVLVSNDTDNGLEFYSINISNRKYQKLFGAEKNVTEAVPSPNGKKIAYTDDNGNVFVYDIVTKTSEKVSSEDSIKYELQWSKSGNYIYFLQGDKSEVISRISIFDKKTVKLLDDKMNYKSDLRVSLDDKVLLYAVTKDGKVTGTDETDIAVDTSNTEPQLFAINIAVEGSKPLQLTSSKDNKLFAGFIDDNNFTYLSVSTEDENAVPVIKVVGFGMNETVIVPINLNIIQSVTANGNIILLADDQDGKRGIYTYTAKNYSMKKISDVSDSVVQLSTSTDGKSILALVDNGGKISISALKYGKLTSITK